MENIKQLIDGDIGGKAKGYFAAVQILESEAFKREHESVFERLRFPVSFCIGTDLFHSFIEDNNFSELVDRCRKSKEEACFVNLSDEFLSGVLRDNYLDDLSKFLEGVEYPLAVRSSSVLEDRPGTSFAGKYETIFVSNRGTLQERLHSLAKAIKLVFASTYCPSAIKYRRRRHLMDDREEMAILIQEAIGREYEGYFMPLMAGVGFSNNGYRWNKEIKKKDGLVRLVFGLGTRAVGRGYARIFTPGKPLSRPEGNDVKEIIKFSQVTIDALNIKNNAIESFPFYKLVKNGMHGYPRSNGLFSLCDEGRHLYTPVTRLWSENHTPILTFDRILKRPWSGLHLPGVIRVMFKVLEESFGFPVDIEFAVRVDENEIANFYLLQARPLSQHEEMKPRKLPSDLPKDDILFSADRGVPSGRVRNIEYVVFVDPGIYAKWPFSERHEVARVVGKINSLLEGKGFILMGPGRWGSNKVDLGVPTRYSEISNCAMLVEIAHEHTDYLPEVSYGTHFFQDLIEDNIVYLPLYPDSPGVIYNLKFFTKNNSLPELLPDEYYRRFDELIHVVHIPSVTGGRRATATLNGEIDKGLVYLK
ncbi:MAG: PEP/pyruvate-binding domain-containing protein [Pseudomonadota bacterium]